MHEIQGFEPYTSLRPDLIIPEYGRNIHNMVDYAKTVADREERNRIAHAIISVMGQLFPHLRDIDDFKHKLWDHLHIMARFELDVDSPYPKPSPETFQSKPDRVAYPKGEPRFGHYGKTVERLIAKARQTENPEEKAEFTAAIANLMKRHFVMYNHATVEDKTIRQQLTMLSEGELQLPDDFEFLTVQDINRIASSGPSNSSKLKPSRKKKPNKKRVG
jgi:hypothetical protein